MMHRGAALVMQPSLQHRRGRSLSSNTEERDEDLVLFHEMHKRERERRSSTSSIQSPSEHSAGTPPATHKSPSPSLHRMPTSTSARGKPPEDIFTSDGDKNDYDWLLTPPGTPLVPSMDHDLTSSRFSLSGTPSVRSLTSIKPVRLGNSRSEPPSRSEPSARVVRANLGLQQPTSTSPSLSNSTTTASRRSLTSSSSMMSRPSTPNSTSVGRPSTPNSTSVGRPSSSYMARPSTPNANSLARPSTPTSTSVAPRLSMSSSNSGARPSTPSSRTSIPSSIRSTSSSRPSTPVRRPSTPSHQSNPPTTFARSSSVGKVSSVPSKSAASSRASSPNARNRAWPATLPGFSQEPPPNLRTSMPERPISNSRGSSVGSRPGGPLTARPTQAEVPDAGARSRRQSSSPLVTRGRISSDSQNGHISIHGNGKVHHSAPETPVLNSINSKMMEKRVNPRKPVPSVQGDQCPVVNPHVKRPTKSTPTLRDVKSTITSVRESSGFGRNLSKKSLDMALRHMDIRRSTPTGFKSFMSNVPPSSLYSVRSGNGRLHSSVGDSPMATSSNASSEHSMSIVLDPEGSEPCDEAISEKGIKISPGSQPDSVVSLSKERTINNWLGSPDYRDNNVEIMQLFEQGIERLSGSESPLVSQLEGAAECVNFTLEGI